MINHQMQNYNFSDNEPLATLADSTELEMTEVAERPEQQTGLHRDNPRVEYLGVDQFSTVDLDKYVEAVPEIGE
jgi:hypothetical protein